MTLSKLFMGWAIGLSQLRKAKLHQQNSSARAIAASRRATWSPGSLRSDQTSPESKVSSPQFRTLRWRLLSSYLGAMTAVVGISTVVVYQVVDYNLSEQLDRQLATLAEAAAHSLKVILADRTTLESRLPREFDHDGDLDIPWQDLRVNDQGVEWFDAHVRLLGQAGSQYSQTPFGVGFRTWHHIGIRTLTIPVYSFKSADSQRSIAFQKQLQGYVRVSQPIDDLQQELHRLLIGLGAGGVIALVLIGGTGFWLTQRSLQPIEQSILQLKQFTADASHELRSPLATVRTAVEVMQSHPERVHPADLNKLESLASATRQMAHLIEDLLLLARTDVVSPRRSVVSLPIPIDEVLEDLVTVLELQANAREIMLRVAGPTDIWVKGDAAQIRRLFANLLENALHYTSAGGTVNVTTQLIRSDVLVKVEDTGIGIAPDQLPRLFDRFWRADQARSHREGGTGLGLSIAQAIAHAHGGEITVTSQMGIGSCFRVRLPIAAKP